ncbi:hypothetical protein [Legionella maioricensis]|uniref:Dot/Icm T4SS effector n=1 Tax=Legionella maioricensis TaxID=2896528 RepID=A0A9X2IBR9_9GAMM|nr:hypothetical protein [Legionella maioricensis]MCL9684516.1 hypothetical protein [Legionella maioricensis]MCL9687890.1 hypothetical protein [Legionella maioricensis]
MKQLVAIIKTQMQQLNHLQLSEWLLSHLKEDANNLTELFAKQCSAVSTPVAVMPSFISQFSSFLPVLSIFYIYAAEPLRRELVDKLSASPELMFADKTIDDAPINRELTERLIIYRGAWPIIVALKTQGIYDLIQILDSANEQTLRSFASLDQGGDVALLVDTFLTKNNKELEAIDRTRLVHFLRRPDLTRWFTEYIESLVSQASHIMSLKLLRLAFTPCTNELNKLAEIKALLADYPFFLHREAMQAVIYFYYAKLKKEPFSAVNGAFISLFYELIKRTDLTIQSELVLSLNQECFFFIIEQGLVGMTSPDLTSQQACKSLLFLLCSETAVPDKPYRDLIKRRLQQLDPYLFDTPEIFELAKEILTASSVAPQGGGCDLCIETLLASPRFVAASTPKVLKQLSDRYLALTTVLDQEEYGPLIESLKKYFGKDDELAIQEYLLNKKQLEGGGEHLVHALWMQFEALCQQQKAHGEETAERALEVLYRYYGQTVPHLRTDLLLRAVDSIYRPLTNDITGLDVAQRKETSLYYPRGQKIGFVNEANEAMAFLAGEVVLLSSTGLIPANEPLLDEQGSIIGYLTESGQIRSADLVQKNASAQLLAMVPEKDLEQSPEGLELLIQNVLDEDSLEALYGSAPLSLDRAKYLWLAQRISTAVRETEYPISSSTFNSLVNHHPDDMLFSLLATMKHEANARSLFHAILNDDKKREILLKGLFASEVEGFLDHHDAVTCLADYMTHYHDKPWFAKGLLCFADYAKKQKKHTLLSDALAQLTRESNKEKQRGELVDAVLKSLIGAEDSARVVLQEFLQDRSETPVQQLKSPEIKKVTQYFYKRHLVVALQVLNETAHWQNSSLYKLVLHLLDTQHEQLFSSKEFNFTVEEPWQKNELNDLADFINRHLSKKRSLDSDFSVGHRVLSELLFRGAKAGQISLFYSKKTFNPAIAHMSFTRPFLECLVDKFWIPEGVKEQFADGMLRIKAWAHDQNPLQKELESHPVLVDWRHLVTQTWKEINKKKLPIICAYLLNYSGSKKPLSCLLRDYINEFQEDPNYLYPVVKLLQQFPQRDVSAVIFDVLEVMIIKNPLLLDGTVLHHMAHYHARTNANQDVKSPEAELNLLIYFGQRKRYPLVQRGCDELAKTCEDKKLKQRLLKGALEAKVETDLSSSQGYFYFSLVKVFKRLWHYGVNAKKNSSGIVSFCDDVLSHPIPKRAPEEVKMPGLSGKGSTTYLEFTERKKQLIRLLATIKHSPVPASLITRPSQISQSLFHGKGETKETVVAQEQAVVHI